MLEEQLMQLAQWHIRSKQVLVQVLSQNKQRLDLLGTVLERLWLELVLDDEDNLLTGLWKGQELGDDLLDHDEGQEL